MICCKIHLSKVKANLHAKFKHSIIETTSAGTVKGNIVRS